MFVNAIKISFATLRTSLVVSPQCIYLACFLLQLCFVYVCVQSEPIVAIEANESVDAAMKALGEKGAEMAASHCPELLTMEVTLINDVLSTLVQVIGAERAVQVSSRALPAQM